jgi:hypothetical protein
MISRGLIGNVSPLRRIAKRMAAPPGPHQSKVQSVDQRMSLGMRSAFANCGRAVAHVRDSDICVLQYLD